MTETYLWHLWPARNWPLSSREEKALVSELATLSPAPAPQFERGDVTAILNMLRLGLFYRDTREFAPGLSPQRLLSAYNYLDHRRRAAQASFERILKHHTMGDLDSHALLASRLAPVPTYRIVTAIRNYEASAHSPDDLFTLKATLSRVKEGIDVSRAAALAAENELTSLAKQARSEDELTRAIRLGRRLYDPYDDCLWSAQFYLPARLTDLVPGRVSDLLEEAEQ